jgi:acetyl esterase/lipase
MSRKDRCGSAPPGHAAGLPPALVITGAADGFSDAGTAIASVLRAG